MSEIEDGCFRVTVHQASSTFLFLPSGKKLLGCLKVNQLNSQFVDQDFLQLNHLNEIGRAHV